MSSSRNALVVGSTGYIGKRLVEKLISEGYSVTATYRSNDKLLANDWATHPRVTSVKVDVLDKESLLDACSGCASAFYLVHSMYAGEKYRELDRIGSTNMRETAEELGLNRIVYLSGLGNISEDTSEHLRSREEVNQILREGSVPVTTFRAAMIVGEGSASFEIMRYLVERLPIMTPPRWVRTKTQPIAVSNVMEYLAGCLEQPETIGEEFDIGGRDVVTYQKLMRIYAEEAELPRRIVIPIPVLTTGLSSYWVGLITPVPSEIAVPLIEGLRTETATREDSITRLIPQKLLSSREAIRLALQGTFQRARGESIKGEAEPAEWIRKGDPAWAGGSFFHLWFRELVPTSAERLWNSMLHSIASNGHNYGSNMWYIRGLLDELTGSQGFRRNAHPSEDIQPGKNTDAWTIRQVKQHRFLVLESDLREPNISSLYFRLKQKSSTATAFELELRYLARGFAGLALW
ncbi:MAG: NAD(P)H-binding protein, partial [Candidatus Lokiarchaeota archaeon]|nr:NAD(P)H-binding protein [Candidatus Lokiarchaeota archaeon]